MQEISSHEDIFTRRKNIVILRNAALKARIFLIGQSGQHAEDIVNRLAEELIDVLDKNNDCSW